MGKTLKMILAGAIGIELAVLGSMLGEKEPQETNRYEQKINSPAVIYPQEREVDARDYSGIEKILGKIDETEREIAPSLDEDRYKLKIKSFDEDSKKVLLARLIYGEARGCSREEKIAVAYTVINRLNDSKNRINRGLKPRFGGGNGDDDDLREVILKNKQYSCFDLGDPNREKLMNISDAEKNIFRECLEISEGVLNGSLADPSDGSATHYLTRKLANSDKAPSWTKNHNKMIYIGALGDGSHVFYREK